MTYLLIALGSALGGVARYACAGWAAAPFGEAFPFGTLIVNVAGSFLIGLVAGLSGPDSRFLIAPDTRHFLMAGFCGGFTTFSAFSLQTLTLVREGALAQAGANIILSVFLCLLATWLGFQAAALISAAKGA